MSEPQLDATAAFVSAEVCAAPEAKPTRYRWVICIMVAAMALVLFLDRTNISIATPLMMRDFGLDRVAMGFVFSAFAWAYALGSLPGGLIGDRYGARIALTVMVLFWSVMTMATAHAAGLASLIVIRFVFGLGEAGAWPAATKAMLTWFPKSERGFVNGSTHGAALFATSAVPLVSVAIIEALGWRSLFHIFGAVGIVWAALWWVLYRNEPGQSARVNKAELAYIQQDTDTTSTAAPEPSTPVPWRRILKSKNMWALGVAYMAFNYTTYFFYYWMPTFLVDHHGITLKSMGLLASLPLGAGAVGSLCGGLATDIVYKRTKNAKLSRRLVCIAAMLGAALFMIPAGLSEQPLLVVMLLALSIFCLALVLAPIWSVAMDVSAGYSGTVSGIMNGVGQAGGSISPIVFGALSQAGYWVAPFYLTSTILVIAALMWAFVIEPELTVLER